MPSNPYVEQAECFRFIEKVLIKTLPEISEGIHINELLRQCLTNYAVSKKAILNFIQECYVETGVIFLEEKTLFFTKK